MGLHSFRNLLAVPLREIRGCARVVEKDSRLSGEQAKKEERIFWGDEMGLRSIIVQVALRKRGQTPVIPGTGKASGEI